MSKTASSPQRIPPLPLNAEAREIYARWCALLAAEKAARKASAGTRQAAETEIARCRQAYSSKAIAAAERIVPEGPEKLKEGILLSDLATLSLLANLSFNVIAADRRADVSRRVRHGLQYALLGAAGIRWRSRRADDIVLPTSGTIG